MNLAELLGKKHREQTDHEIPRVGKEEYAAQKKAEREAVWERVDAQTARVFQDDSSMRSFLDFMARCTPQSTRNLLILSEQNPEITHPRTFEKWKEAGRSIRAGEKGYVFFAEQDYEKEDGTKASGYQITRAYDISQTRGWQAPPVRQYDPEELIAAMAQQSHALFTVTDQLPPGVQAQYVPRQRAIYVRDGMEAVTAFCCLAREEAHAHFDSLGSGYTRQSFAPQSYCAAYVVARRYGVDVSAFRFDKVCGACAGMDVRGQRGFLSDVTLVHLAESKEQLDSDTESIVSTARRHLCQMSTLRWQQKDGLDTVLPYGLRRIQALRTLTTESTAVLIPFRAQEILQEGGIYYGQNAVSKNMIVADRRKLLNGNSFRLGVSGSGKSFSAKEEIVSIALATGDDILILDPESEFGTLTESLGGEVIRISASSDTHLNAMDMDGAYGDERNPLIEKSEFILSLFEQLIGAGGVSAKEKSILDRCTYDVYREYQANRFQGEPPTLRELYHALLSQPEPEARGLALSSELFITGSLNTFAQHTNVNTKARILCYDIRELGEQLICIVILFSRYQEEKNRNSLSLLANQLMEKNYQGLAASQLILSKQLHDFGNHLKTLEALTAESPKAQQYISQLLSATYKNMPRCRSGNDM